MIVFMGITTSALKRLNDASGGPVFYASSARV